MSYLIFNMWILWVWIFHALKEAKELDRNEFRKRSHIPFCLPSCSTQSVLLAILSVAIRPSYLILLCQKHYVPCGCAKPGHWPALCSWTMGQTAESESWYIHKNSTYEYYSATVINKEAVDGSTPMMCTIQPHFCTCLIVLVLVHSRWRHAYCVFALCLFCNEFVWLFMVLWLCLCICVLYVCLSVNVTMFVFVFLCVLLFMWAYVPLCFLVCVCGFNFV